MTINKKQALRVGFDLDGVLLYNPARIVRPLIALLKRKKIAINRKELEFYVPEPGFKQFLWELLHKSSLFLAPGFDQIEKLKAAGLIEPYLITGRFRHLKKDYLKWKKKMQADDLFLKCYINDHDEQPHLFKERIIQELKLDVFVEDNWDIVNYLNQSHYTTRIYWITNIIDYRLEYPQKFLSLKLALKALKILASNKKD